MLKRYVHRRLSATGGDLGGGTGRDRPPQIIRWRGQRCFYPHPQYSENVIANCYSKREWEREKMRHQRLWPTYKQHRPIIQRLQQLHVAVRHSNCLLGSMMTQVRLNSLTVCHVHQEVLHVIDVDALINEFVSSASMFGKWLCTVVSHQSILCQYQYYQLPSSHYILRCL